jgi:hypothetical protein
VVQVDGQRTAWRTAVADARSNTFGQRLSDVIFPKDVQSDNPAEELMLIIVILQEIGIFENFMTPYFI